MTVLLGIALTAALAAAFLSLEDLARRKRP